MSFGNVLNSKDSRHLGLRSKLDRNTIKIETPPEDRIRDPALFEVVGVDLAVPVLLYDGTKIG